MNNIYAVILDKKKTYFLDWLHSSLSKVKKYFSKRVANLSKI